MRAVLIKRARRKGRASPACLQCTALHIHRKLINFDKFSTNERHAIQFKRLPRVRLSKLHINEIIYSRGGTKCRRRAAPGRAINSNEFISNTSPTPRCSPFPLSFYRYVFSRLSKEKEKKKEKKNAHRFLISRADPIAIKGRGYFAWIA